ncbi:hypothetical protein TELCIR_07603 [Teladorsagia circumcincta]|uniref:Uncharacterized protein n=1 Tax=Teladorsagia circumcincta TaxID=45464 RepID=A0A2G9UK72_TELCI|nr:hypothetical protein TELCIR_07603 [Teladorsagia circumcincta]
MSYDSLGLHRGPPSFPSSSTVIYFTACDFRNHLSIDESYKTVLGERLLEHATLNCQGSKYDELVSSSFFEIPSLDEECSTLVPDSRTESALLECKEAETQDVGISEQLHAKAPEISDTLEVLPSCSVASSSFSCSVISKASKVVSSYATTVRAPTKLQPRPVSDSFCLSADVDSTVKVATRLAPADGGDLQSCPPTPRPIKETRKSARSRVDLPTVCAELAVAFKSKSRSCSCVGVSIVTEEFENVEATFKEYTMKVHEIKHDRLLAKQQHSVVKGASAANAHREVGDSSTETQSRAPVTRRQRRNLQSNNPSINTYQRSSPSSASGTLAKAPVPVDSVPSKSPSPIIEVQSKVHASCQNGKPLNTPASAIPTRSRICKHASTEIRQSSESQNISNIKAQYASSFVGETLSRTTKELAHSPAETHSQRRSGRVKRPNESTETVVAEKRKRSSAAENISCDLAPLDPDTAQLTEVETLSALLRRKSSRLLAAQTETVSPLASPISKYVH